jgi:hypothetical protein
MYKKKEVESLSQRGILILTNCHICNDIREGERTCDGELRNTTLLLPHYTTINYQLFLHFNEKIVK